MKRKIIFSIILFLFLLLGGVLAETTISQTTFNLNIEKGKSSSGSFSVSETSTANITITKTGTASDWLTLTPSTFFLNASSQTVNFVAGVPSTTSIGQYYSVLDVNSKAVIFNINITESVIIVDNPLSVSPIYYSKDMIVGTQGFEKSFRIRNKGTKIIIIDSIDFTKGVTETPTGKKPVKINEINEAEILPNGYLDLKVIFDATDIQPDFYPTTLTINGFYEGKEISKDIKIDINVKKSASPSDSTTTTNQTSLSMPDIASPNENFLIEFKNKPVNSQVRFVKYPVNMKGSAPEDQDTYWKQQVSIPTSGTYEFIISLEKDGGILNSFNKTITVAYGLSSFNRSVIIKCNPPNPIINVKITCYGYDSITNENIEVGWQVENNATNSFLTGDGKSYEFNFSKGNVTVLASSPLRLPAKLLFNLEQPSNPQIPPENKPQYYISVSPQAIIGSPSAVKAINPKTGISETDIILRVSVDNGQFYDYENNLTINFEQKNYDIKAIKNETQIAFLNLNMKNQPQPQITGFLFKSYFGFPLWQILTAVIIVFFILVYSFTRETSLWGGFGGRSPPRIDPPSMGYKEHEMEG